MKSIKPLPPLRDLEAWFSINGRDLVWRSSYFSELVGKRAGYRRPDGYIEVRKSGHKMLAHRVVYFLASGEDPGNRFVDHIDGDPSNNNPENLRIATNTENMRNVRRLRANNTSGRHGVYQTSVAGISYWKACVYLNGKPIHLGSYGCKEAAIAARDVAERFLYGDFSPIGPGPASASFLDALDASDHQSRP